MIYEGSCCDLQETILFAKNKDNKMSLLKEGVFAFIINNRTTLLFNFITKEYTYISTKLFSNIIFTNSEIPDSLNKFFNKSKNITKKELKYMVKVRAMYKILNLAFEQLFTLPSTVIERCNSYDYRTVLLVGDDDLHSLYITKFKDAEVTLIEIDPLLIRFLKYVEPKIRIINEDVRNLPKVNKHDFGITLPPNSKNGWHLFVGYLLKNCNAVLAPLPVSYLR